MALSRFFKPTSQFSIFLYIALRVLQVSALFIAAFVFSYLVWQHSHHYCSDFGFGYDCDISQRAEADIPAVYVWLLMAIVASIVSAFFFTYKHLTAVFDVLADHAPFPRYPIVLETPADVPNKADEEKSPASFLIVQSIRRAFLLTDTAVLNDVFLLVIFFASLTEYTWHVLWGPVLPYTWLWSDRQRNVGQLSAYYRELKVIEKEAILSKCGCVASLFAMGFVLLIVALEVYYSRCEWIGESVVDEVTDDFRSTTTSGPSPDKE